MKCEIITGNMPQLWIALFSELKERGYADGSLRYYREGLGKIDYYMRTNGITVYSEDVGKAFLNAHNVLNKQGPRKRSYYMRCCVQRLNDVLAGRKYVVMHQLKQRQQLQSFGGIFETFVNSLYKQNICQSTCCLQSYYCYEFLRFVEDSGITAPENIDAQVVFNAFRASMEKVNFCVSARKFLRFLFQQGLHSIDLSEFVPSVRRPKPVPTTYTAGEISELLGVADLSTSKGLRDYAILLLAARLGLRVSDICNLELGDICRDSNTIEFVQMKTGVPAKLELLPEIRVAIDAYITRARPHTDSKKVFIRANRPFVPIGRTAVVHIVERYLEKTDIDTKGKKRGPHTLRMSLATTLVAENVSYSVVHKILGHQSALSFNNYVRLDIEKLRQCALDVPPASGRLKDWLYPVGKAGAVQ